MIALLSQYWFIIALIVIVVVSYVAKRYLQGTLRTHILKYLLAAEHLVFTTTEARLSVVCTAAYSALPAPIKAMVSPVAFEIAATEVYNEVKQLVDELNANPSVPVQKSTAPTK